jgi:prepilin-type N-terminal cleavage/methylation domain-containing protein
MNHKAPRGLTLIEIVVAMLVFAIGALGLAASSASLARDIAWNSDRHRASSLARARLETLSASRCASGAGTDRAGSVSNDWVATTTASVVTIDQTIKRADSRGSHVDMLHGGAPCN